VGPNFRNRLWRKVALVFFGGGLCLLIYFFVTRKRRHETVVVGEDGRYLFLVTGLAILPAMAASIIYFANDQYLVLQSICLLCCFGFLVSQTFPPAVSGLQSQKGGVVVASLLGATLFWATPILASNNPTIWGVPPQPNVKTIEFIDNLGLSGRINVLVARARYGVFLGENFATNWHVHKKRNESAKEYFESRRIEMVIVEQPLLRDSRFVNDAGWKRLIQDPSIWGFVKIRVPATDRYLLVHRSRAPPRGTVPGSASSSASGDRE
jgi:hypothetical protein